MPKSNGLGTPDLHGVLGIPAYADSDSARPVTQIFAVLECKFISDLAFSREHELRTGKARTSPRSSPSVKELLPLDPVPKRSFSELWPQDPGSPIRELPGTWICHHAIPVTSGLRIPEDQRRGQGTLYDWGRRCGDSYQSRICITSCMGGGGTALAMDTRYMFIYFPFFVAYTKNHTLYPRDGTPEKKVNIINQALLLNVVFTLFRRPFRRRQSCGNVYGRTDKETWAGWLWNLHIPSRRTSERMERSGETGLTMNEQQVGERNLELQVFPSSQCAPGATRPNFQQMMLTLIQRSSRAQRSLQVYIEFIETSPAARAVGDKSFTGILNGGGAI
ncbi:hypothetical protein B0H11DRAFT_2206558 [Mycena galericulata]|nr:hypothetical protein B0H11DRAFT_2206558 [Mycena galericulata]